MLGTTETALLSRFLVWRIAQAAPADARASDVDARLRQAGRAFRRCTRPLSRDELAHAVSRLRAAS